MKTFCGISGKDSACTALVFKALNPGKHVTYFFNDTGAEYPELYEWLHKVETTLGQEIHYVSADLHKIIEQESSKTGAFLPNRNVRYCTRLAKIKPMQEFIAEISREPCQILYGLRKDEEDRKGFVPLASENATPVYPLIELGFDLRAVYSFLDTKDLLPPNHRWDRLETAVKEKVGCEWMHQLPRWYVDHLLRGRSRDNCYFCFNQSAWELLYMLETHPDLYERASSFEKPGFSWVRDFGLAEFKVDAARQHRVFNLRVSKVMKLIEKAIANNYEFEDNELALTSCGLLCGK